jgi:hypothetical protein
MNVEFSPSELCDFFGFCKNRQALASDLLVQRPPLTEQQQTKSRHPMNILPEGSYIDGNPRQVSKAEKNQDQPRRPHKTLNQAKPFLVVQLSGI